METHPYVLTRCKHAGGKQFIENLVSIHTHFAAVFDEECGADKDFHSVLKQAFQKHIINNAGNARIETV